MSWENFRLRNVNWDLRFEAIKTANRQTKTKEKHNRQQKFGYQRQCWFRFLYVYRINYWFHTKAQEAKKIHILTTRENATMTTRGFLHSFKFESESIDEIFSLLLFPLEQNETIYEIDN